MDMADKAVLYSCLCFFREFGEVGAAKPDVVRFSEGASAAFRRLCVETARTTSASCANWVCKPFKGQSDSPTASNPVGADAKMPSELGFRRHFVLIGNIFVKKWVDIICIY